MKIFTLLMIIVIVMGTNHQSKFNYGKQRSLMAVMAEVEAKIKSHSPLDAVLEILTQFKQAVNQEQVNHDQIFIIEQNECESELQFRNSEIVNARNALRDSNNQLQICSHSKNRVTEQQQANQQQEYTFQQHLNSIVSQAEIESGYFKKRSAQYEDSLHAIDEALRILEGISFGYRNFAELSKVSQRLLQTSFDIKFTQQFAPIFKQFIMLAKQGEYFDLSALQTVEHLLRDLQQNIQQTFSEFIQSNSQLIALFNNQKEKVNKVLQRLQQQYERQLIKLDKLNACINVQQATSNTALGKEQRNQQLLNQAQQLCQTFETEFNFATKSRRDEIKLVNQLEEMVKQRFEEVNETKQVLYYAKMKY